MDERQERHSEAQEALSLLLSSPDDGVGEIEDLEREVLQNIARLGQHEAATLVRDMVDRMAETMRQNRRYIIATNERITALHKTRDDQIASILKERLAPLETGLADAKAVNREFITLRNNTVWAIRILFAAAAALITNSLIQFFHDLVLHHH